VSGHSFRAEKSRTRAVHPARPSRRGMRWSPECGGEKRASDPSMPIGLVGEGIDVDATRRRFAGESLPTAAAVSMRDRYLEAVGREPAGVIVVLVAVAPSAAGPLHHDRSGAELAHDSVRPGVGGRGVLAHISDVSAVGRNEHILVRGPDILRKRCGLDLVLTQSQPEYLTLWRRRILGSLKQAYHQAVSDYDG